MTYDAAAHQPPGTTKQDLARAMPHIIMQRAGLAVQNPHPLSGELGDRCTLRDFAGWCSPEAFNPKDGGQMSRAIRSGISSVTFSEALEATGRQIITQTHRAASPVSLIARGLPQRDLRPVQRGRVVVTGLRDDETYENGEAPILHAGVKLIEQRHHQTFMNAIYISRETVFNDDVMVIAELFREAARMAAAREWRAILQKLEANPTTPELDKANGDARAFFTVDDGNLLATTSAPTVSGMQAAVAALRKQPGADGRPMNLHPSRLLVPADHEVKFRQVLKEAEFSDLTVITTPEITSNCYLLTNPDRLAAVGMGYMGLPGSRITTWTLERVPRLPPTFMGGIGYHLHQAMLPMLLSRRGIVRVPLT